ncbi:glycosyltransferase family 2 protein [Cellulosilyticum lentocellum]|uniref:Glycosyl transferase family 2 n=1 Tax=Cellulosilyticum lentocellum (strain ATCC 49066 / DSM 5427 / NCIMB 11756 / RHM5) TaxID=642492 RepID=F2JLP2_CELLD|nr:glycosyltransferase family 2 protein [Cellulosilyticum lentocellum]ADZ83433.1 glycosyl transferase family 2 [Cellulosilyticum lentocellum DSM 5427]
MKKVSIVIPTYNEEENVMLITSRVEEIMTRELNQYDYEILFIDNCSTDRTRELLRNLCKTNKKVKVILNAKNFGQSNSPYYALLQTTGDCVIGLVADFQDPPEMIVDFVKKWEEGYRIVIGIKTTSKENKIMYFLRGCYYKTLKKIANVEQIEQFTGFGLYDRSFIEVLRGLKDPMPYFRGIVAELGFERAEIEYVQPKRERGKSKNNFFTLFDFGMLGITSYSKAVLRLATIGGFIIGGISFVVGIIYFIMKLIYWERFVAGMAPILIGMFFLGAAQLFFIGFLGEYIMNINARVMNRPLVVEEERINFEKERDIQGEKNEKDES